jgi:cytidine deaminase
MIDELKELLDNSHSPYYHYKVAAIVVTNDGNKFKGVNVETSSPAAGICAERNAIYQAISNGYKKQDFKELHVMVDNKDYAEPCFICRQALVDFTDEEMPIYLYSKNSFDKMILRSELTPHPFENEDLL